MNPASRAAGRCHNDYTWDLADTAGCWKSDFRVQAGPGGSPSFVSRERRVHYGAEREKTEIGEAKRERGRPRCPLPRALLNAHKSTQSDSSHARKVPKSKSNSSFAVGSIGFRII